MTQPTEKAKMKFPNRLRCLIERELPEEKSLTDKMQKFATENAMGFDNVKRCVYGSTRLTRENAAMLAKKYHVSEGWLLGAPLNKYDVIDILKAFSTLLSVKQERTPIYANGKLAGHTVFTLYMDAKFFEILSAVKALQYQKETDISLDDETYKRRMEKIFTTHKDYFIEKFNTNHFDVDRAIEIENLELL